MAQLIKNELLKIGYKKTIFVFFIFILFLQITSAFFIRNWLPVTERFSSFATFTQLNFTFLMPLLTIYCISLIVRSIAEEYSQGTIKQLLIRPHYRTSILLSKLIAIFCISLLLIISILLFSSLIGGIRFGFVTDDFSMILLLRYTIYKTIPVIFYTTLAFLIVTITTTTILPMTISLLIVLTQDTLNQLVSLALKKQTDFFILTHMNIHTLDKEPLLSEGGSMLKNHFSLLSSPLYILAHLILMIMIACIIFKRRDVL